LKARARPLHLVALVTVLVLTLSVALAQPYAADGGFDRPRELVASMQRPAVALAVDRGVAVVAYIDRGRILRLPLAPQEDARRVAELASGESYWDVVAAGSRDGSAPAVYAWYRRDFTTGRYVYTWHADGETRRLFEAQQVLEVRVVIGPDGPEAWVTRMVPSGAVLERIAWSDGPDAAPEVVLTSELALSGADVVYDDAGTLHLAYLEGFSEATEFGVNDEWSGRYLRLGERTGAEEPVDLGRAAPPPGRVAIALDELRVVWSTDTGEVVATVPATGDTIRLGPGRPVAATAEHVIWSEGATLAARSRPLAGGTLANVAWSPIGIERAVAAQDTDGVTHLVWVGRRAGGGYAVLASDDRTPMVRTVSDRVAATFGWSPWSLAEEAAGQVAGALLAAVLVTMALIPLFWLVASLLVGRVPHERTRLFGALSGAAVIASAIAGLVIVTTLPTELVLALTGLPWVAPVALLVAVAIGSRSVRTADLESLQALVLTACVTSLVATALLAFATFQEWLAFLGL
jgi:hypothetical protein